MRTIVLSVVCVLALAVTARADLKNLVPIKDVPAATLKAADRAAPGVQWVIARKSVERGKDYFFILGRETAGKRRLILFIGSDDGKVGYVRVTVPLAEVPEVVTRALKAAHPDFRATEAQATGATVRQIVGYRFEGRTGSGSAIFLVSNNGKKIIRE
jgi:hypothetical protein